MPIYDFECDACGKIEERLLPIRKAKMLYSCECGGRYKRIITMSGEHIGNQDAPWVRTIADIIPKDDNADAHDRRFLKSGMTRKDLENWKNGKGLRHMEPGEKPRKPEPPNMEKVNERLTKRLMRRNRIEI